MANPSPQHTPTDGLGVAAYIQLSGNKLVADVTVGSAGVLPANPVKYTLTLSLTSAGGYSNTCSLTPSLVDVKNNSYTAVGSEVYYSYGDPGNAAGSAPKWYNPSLISGYSGDIASVNSSGVITARNLGQTVIEVSFPTFDNTLGNDSAGESEPDNFIYVQVVVTVIP